MTQEVTETVAKKEVPVQSIAKQSAKAIKALQDHHNKKTKEGDAQEHDDHVHLVVSVKKIAAKATLKPHRVHLPHPFRRVEDASVCLIVKDPLEKEKARIPVDTMPCLQLVESVKTLSNKYKPFEAKRLLCASHDLFLADERVLPCLPKLLGKVFFDKKKQPVPVNLTTLKIGEELRSAVESTFLYLNTGPCISVKVGKISQPVADIQANVEAVLKQMDKRLPEGGLSNVRVLSVKTATSISLPIYEARV